MRGAYYNEIDPYAAAWLRNLIAAGHIAPGDVDERSIEDVRPDDIRGYTQCHWFAGIGVWSYALRRAGWPDDRPVWTGSCPCQPFSAAGKGAGFDDERHLWPDWHHLISECKPAAVFGEQVASSDVGPWIDLVQDDLEAMGYAFGAVALPSAGVGAPHIRDRTYFVAYADQQSGRQGRAINRGRNPRGNAQPRAGSGSSVLPDVLGDATGTRPQGGEQRGERSDAQRPAAERAGAAGRLADAQRNNCGCETEPADNVGQEANGSADRAGGCGGASGPLADAIMQQRPDREPGICDEHDAGGRFEDPAAAAGLRGDLRPGPVNGFWSGADWLLCRDGKWRPVRSGTFPLAHGAASRVGRLRAYGNAINAQAAEAFIRAAM